MNNTVATDDEQHKRRDMYMSGIDWEKRRYMNAYDEDDLWRANALAFSELDIDTYTHSLRVASQREFDEDHPDHPLELSSRTLKAVALLHDVLEDGKSNLTLSDLTNMRFSKQVVKAVDLLTRQLDQDQTYVEYLNRLSWNNIARTVKIADLRDNLYGRPTPPNESLANRYSKALTWLTDRQEDVIKAYKLKETDPYLTSKKVWFDFFGSDLPNRF